METEEPGAEVPGQWVVPVHAGADEEQGRKPAGYRCGGDLNAFLGEGASSGERRREFGRLSLLLLCTFYSFFWLNALASIE